jgi:hypothetical protein
MTAASGTARTKGPHHGTDRTTEYPRTIRAPVSPPPDHQAPSRSPQGRLRRRPRRPGCARSLTRPSGPPRTWQLPGKQETPVTHARKQPPPTQNPPLTRPRSFRDDTEGSHDRTTSRDPWPHMRQSCSPIDVASVVITDSPPGRADPPAMISTTIGGLQLREAFWEVEVDCRGCKARGLLGRQVARWSHPAASQW